MSSIAFATKESNVLVSHHIVLTPKEEISDASHFLLLFNLK